MNNYEKIKLMNIEEMAEFLCKSPCQHCVDLEARIYDRKYCLKKCILPIRQWLEMEAE